jgi:hypothetical protein
MVTNNLPKSTTALLKTGHAANAAPILIDIPESAPPAKTRKVTCSTARIW